MRKAIWVLAMLSAGLPALAGAAGYHNPGFMLISNDYGFMMGSFNVRYNAAAPATSHIAAVSYSGGGEVSFFGYGNTSFSNVDAGPSAYFSCYVPATSSLYSEALAIKNSLKNGTVLSINKDLSTHECTAIMSMQHSAYQD